LDADHKKALFLEGAASKINPEEEAKWGIAESKAPNHSHTIHIIWAAFLFSMRYNICNEKYIAQLLLF